MAALDRIMCPAVTVIEFVVGQMGCEVDASWHAPFYNSSSRRRITWGRTTHLYSLSGRVQRAFLRSEAGPFMSRWALGHALDQPCLRKRMRLGMLTSLEGR
jgi:hypothetical protein